MDDRALTVGQLVAALREFSDDKPVTASYDSRCAEGAVVKIEADPHHHSGPGVLLIVE